MNDLRIGTTVSRIRLMQPSFPHLPLRSAAETLTKMLRGPDELVDIGSRVGWVFLDPRSDPESKTSLSRALDLEP